MFALLKENDMKKNMKNKFAVVIFSLLIFGVFLMNTAAQVSQIIVSEPGSLTKAWNLAALSPQSEIPEKSGFVRGKIQSITMNSVEAIAASDELEFIIPSGKSLIGYRSPGVTSGERKTWEGFLCPSDKTIDKLCAEQHISVILVFDQNRISGVIYDSSGVYEIVSSGKNQYLVEYIQNYSENCQVMAEDSAVSEFRSQNDSKSSGFDWDSRTTVTSSQDSGDRVDVMVVYTEAVTSSFGSIAQTELFVETMMATTNAVLRNSLNRARVNLVRSAQISYADTGNSSADLSWVKASPIVAQLRDDSNADLVVMITNSGDACGTSQLLTRSGINSASGFAVVKRSCAVGGNAFAHEIGHLFGADHDPTDSPIPPAMHVLPFAYGKAVNGQFVTLMGFFSNSVCPAYCPRVLMFSNPAVLYNGTPTGVTSERDNARVVEFTADAVANIRVSQRTITLQSPNTNVTWRRNMIRQITWDSSNLTGNVRIELSRDGGRSFQVLSESTPNTGITTISVTGPTTRQARIRVVSIVDPLVTDTSLANFSII